MLSKLNLIYRSKVRLKKIINIFSRRPISYGKEIYKRPWDFPEIMLLEYLYKANHKQDLFIIGAAQCYELESISHTKKIGQIVILEPSPNTQKDIKENIRRYHKSSILIQAAASNHEGFRDFFKTNIEGTGSLLKLGEISRKHHALTQRESIRVEVTTVDKVSEKTKVVPNILWIDVQGAELMVLEGAKNVLKEVNIIFLETSVIEPCYENGCTLDQIETYLKDFGFYIMQLGSDPSNGTGNAIFMKGMI